MATRSMIGYFEALVLSCILRIGEDAYGVPIRREAEAMGGREVSVGALYTTLDRLETKGFVSSRMGEATPERGGRAKKYFKVEGSGVVALQEYDAAQRRVGEGLGVLQPVGGMV